MCPYHKSPGTATELFGAPRRKWHLLSCRRRAQQPPGDTRGNCSNRKVQRDKEITPSHWRAWVFFLKMDDGYIGGSAYKDNTEVSLPLSERVCMLEILVQTENSPSVQ